MLLKYAFQNRQYAYLKYKVRIRSIKVFQYLPSTSTASLSRRRCVGPGPRGQCKSINNSARVYSLALMDAKLKSLKVVDLKQILSKAGVSAPAKANKSDLISKILASQEAIDAYNAQYPSETPNDDLVR